MTAISKTQSSFYRRLYVIRHWGPIDSDRVSADAERRRDALGYPPRS